MAGTTAAVRHLEGKAELATAHAQNSEPSNTSRSSRGTSFVPIVIEEEKMKMKKKVCFKTSSYLSANL